MAAERVFGVRPAGMHYVALKGGIEEIGWDAPFPDGFFERAVQKTVGAVEEIRAGRVRSRSVQPGQVPLLRLPRCLPRGAGDGEAADAAEGA